MTDCTERRVVCAACKLEDGTLVLGARHMDQQMNRAKESSGKQWMHSKDAQGFIDQRCVYMTRQEAWKVAKAAGQILYRCGGDTIGGGYLFSENLY
jgi:hypothetical protein